jgi:hypothetical protein
MIPVSLQCGFPTHMDLEGWGPLLIANQATNPIAELTPHFQHPPLKRAFNLLSVGSSAPFGESNQTAPLVYSDRSTQFYSSRKRDANNSGQNLSVETEIIASGWRPASGVTINLELKANAPAASIPHVPWQGHLDHLVSTGNCAEPVRASLLDASVANDDDYCTVSSLTASPCSCDTTLREPRFEANEVSQLTMTSSDWNDVDFGICLECNVDSSDRLDTISLESIWDTDAWNV